MQQPDFLPGRATLSLWTLQQHYLPWPALQAGRGRIHLEQKVSTDHCYRFLTYSIHSTRSTCRSGSASFTEIPQMFWGLVSLISCYFKCFFYVSVMYFFSRSNMDPEIRIRKSELKINKSKFLSVCSSFICE